MRVTPSTPSPRSSLSTTSHFGSQAQTPIQGRSPSGPAAGVGGGLGGAPLLRSGAEAHGKVLDYTALVLGRSAAVHLLRRSSALRACSAGSCAQPFLHSANRYGHPPCAITVPGLKDQCEWTQPPPLCPGSSLSPAGNSSWSPSCLLELDRTGLKSLRQTLVSRGHGGPPSLTFLISARWLVGCLCPGLG